MNNHGPPTHSNNTENSLVSTSVATHTVGETERQSKLTVWQMGHGCVCSVKMKLFKPHLSQWRVRDQMTLMQHFDCHCYYFLSFIHCAVRSQWTLEFKKRILGRWGQTNKPL